MSTSAAAQHSQPGASTSQILQPNPYAQVDPPGSGNPPSAPVGMRPSPHPHTGHVTAPREVHGRNEQSQTHNGGLAYPNPQGAMEQHAANHQHMRGPSIADQYRGRDMRQDFDARNAERDMSREVGHRADTLRDSLVGRAAAPPQPHQDVRYQTPQERGYPPQRSHTPLSRADHAPPLLQHPPHSSLGDSHSLYGSQRQEDHRFRDPFPRDNRMDRVREEHAQQQHQQQPQHQQQRVPMPRDDYHMNRDREIREREMRDREFRDSMMRRGQPPPPLPPSQGPPPEQKPGAPDWVNGVGRERWQR